MATSAKGKKLDIIETVKEGFSIGIGGIVPFFVNVLLWVLTIWIPYLNVGTTIGLWVGIVSKASRGEAIPATEIFDPKYRKYMGEYFLTCGLVGVGVGVGIAFGIIPGIVIGIAWSLALLFVVDKEKNFSEAISMSNEYTYGNKGRIFCIYFLVFLAIGLIIWLISEFLVFLASRVGLASLWLILSIIIQVAISFFMSLVLIGLQASIYKQLTKNKK